MLRDLLNDRFVNGNIAGVIGSSVTVSTMPPDKVVQENGVEATQLNLFLRHVTPNIGWRNEGQPARDPSGRDRMNNVPLALNLHYLVSAYGAQDLHSEILLGYAMQLLHEYPVITREAIRTSLEPPPDVGATLPAHLQALADTGLADQVEQLRITPEYLSTEEMSKFWTSTLAHYRPSAAYQVSVVLIQARKPSVQALPVLTRNIKPLPSLDPWVPTLTTITRQDKQPVAQLDTVMSINGFHLDGTTPQIRLINDRFRIDVPVTPTFTSPDRLEFSIPGADAVNFAVGVYKAEVSVTPAGESAVRTSNQLGLTIAPRIAGLPMTVTRAGGTATFNLGITPALRAGQSVSLVLGAREFEPAPFAAGATSLHFEIADAPVDDHVARLRVDGIDSPIIDMTAQPPKFLDQRIKIQ